MKNETLKQVLEAMDSDIHIFTPKYKDVLSKSEEEIREMGIDTCIENAFKLGLKLGADIFG